MKMVPFPSPKIPCSKVNKINTAPKNNKEYPLMYFTSVLELSLILMFDLTLPGGVLTENPSPELFLEVWLNPPSLFAVLVYICFYL